MLRESADPHHTLLLCPLYIIHYLSINEWHMIDTGHCINVSLRAKLNDSMLLAKWKSALKHATCNEFLTKWRKTDFERFCLVPASPFGLRNLGYREPFLLSPTSRPKRPRNKSCESRKFPSSLKKKRKDAETKERKKKVREKRVREMEEKKESKTFTIKHYNATHYQSAGVNKGWRIEIMHCFVEGCVMNFGEINQGYIVDITWKYLFWCRAGKPVCFNEHVDEGKRLVVTFSHQHISQRKEKMKK